MKYIRTIGILILSLFVINPTVSSFKPSASSSCRQNVQAEDITFGSKKITLNGCTVSLGELKRLLALQEHSKQDPQKKRLSDK